MLLINQTEKSYISEFSKFWIVGDAETNDDLKDQHEYPFLLAESPMQFVGE